MPDDYQHLPVTPDELQRDLYEAHGGPPSDEAVAAALDELRNRGADDDDPDPTTNAETDPGAHASAVEQLEDIDDCPVCGQPVGRGGVPAHIAGEHGD